MHIEQHIPAIRLRPFIKTFLFIESEAALNNFILPDTSMVMAFRYKGTVAITQQGISNHLPAAVLSGVLKTSRTIHYAKDTANLLVVFEPGGAAAFFKEPLHELSGMSGPLDCFINRTQLAEVEERLAAAKNSTERISIMEQFLLSRITEKNTDLLISASINCIRSANGTLKIKGLADSLYISHDSFEKRFRRSVGTSPKHFLSITRLRKAIYGHRPEKSLTDTALEAGYYDQAHFIKDFKAFTGSTPRHFFNEQTYW